MDYQESGSLSVNKAFLKFHTVHYFFSKQLIHVWMNDKSSISHCNRPTTFCKGPPSPPPDFKLSFSDVVQHNVFQPKRMPVRANCQAMELSLNLTLTEIFYGIFNSLFSFGVIERMVYMKLLIFFSAVSVIFGKKEQPSNWYIFDDI